MNTVQKMYRRADLEKITGLPRTTLYAKIAKGEFPKPVHLGERAVAWLEKDIAEWQASLQKTDPREDHAGS